MVPLISSTMYWQDLIIYKSDIKCQSTLGCLDQYTVPNNIKNSKCRGLRLWNSQDNEAVQANKYVQRVVTVKQSRL